MLLLVTTVGWKILEGHRKKQNYARGLLSVASPLFFALEENRIWLINNSRCFFNLADDFRDVVYYGDISDTKDPNTVLIHWKMPDGNYRVIFADLRSEIVTGEKLIKLQADMLQKKAK